MPYSLFYLIIYFICYSSLNCVFIYDKYISMFQVWLCGSNLTWFTNGCMDLFVTNIILFINKFPKYTLSTIFYVLISFLWSVLLYFYVMFLPVCIAAFCFVYCCFIVLFWMCRTKLKHFWMSGCLSVRMFSFIIFVSLVGSFLICFWVLFLYLVCFWMRNVVFCVKCVLFSFVCGQWFIVCLYLLVFVSNIWFVLFCFDFYGFLAVWIIFFYYFLFCCSFCLDFVLFVSFVILIILTFFVFVVCNSFICFCLLILCVLFAHIT